jgi:molecular chaperone DnaK
MTAANEPAVGIDLGTTFSLVAHLDLTGSPRSLVNSEGDLLTPSVVLFDQSSMVVGKEAVRAAPLEPDRVAEFAKRDMGSTHYSKSIAGKQFPPEVIQAMILEKLRKDAEAHLGPFKKVVITVPAFFNEPRRKATQDAGQLAGLEVIDIINEPTAAAIAFGYHAGFLAPGGESRQAERILVYDLGGGTFDVTIMEINGRHYNTRATAGDVYLGGIDWDRRLVDYFAEEFLKKHRGQDPRHDASAMQKMLREAEDAKRALSAREQTTATIEFRGDGLRIPVTRAQFEQLTADLLERSRLTVRAVLKDAGLKWSDLTRVLLVGGSSRMPMVARMLEEESGLKPDRSVSADEAVAHGAALYAGLLLSNARGAKPEMQVTNVSSHDLGVLATEKSTGRPRNVVLIPRNTALPAAHSKRFKTQKDGQQSIFIKVIEGGDSSGNNSTGIGTCTIRNLPATLPRGTPVDVTFTYQENGRLTVSAKVANLKGAAVLNLERTTGLTDKHLAAWGQQLQSGRPLEFNAN